MNTFLVIFNAKEHSRAAIDAMDSLVKGEFQTGCEFIPVLSSLDLSVFLVRTRMEEASLRARLDEMNDDSIPYWLAEHMSDLVPIQLESALKWSKQRPADNA
jgi:hypothetical protein